MAKKTAEMARLRQTCCLGLSSEIIVPKIIEDLHRVIACERMHFAWSDDLGNVVNAYFEKPDPAALDYLRNHIGQLEEDTGISVRAAILFGKPTGNFRWPYRPGFEQTETYARLWRALKLHYSLDGVLRDRFRPFGQIVLFRGDDDRDFNIAEEATLAQVLPYITHAISGPKKTPDAFVETGDSGLIVFDAAGKVTFQSRQAKELCIYALYERIPVGVDVGISLHDMEARLKDLYTHAVRVHDAPDALANPPAWSLTNKWGEFQLRAYVLEGLTGGGRAYGVTIEKKVPVEVRMLQKVKELPLSNKQREVCYLLLRGVETEQIALMLGITRTTLKEHTQAIYRKVGVGKREELLRLVLD